MDARTQLRPSTVVVDLSAIEGNVRTLAGVAGGAEVCAVVKADGYGHGAVLSARAALVGGATWLAVALVEEGEQLRAAGITAPVLLLSEPPPAGAGRVVEARLTPAVYSPEYVAALDMAVARRRDDHAPAGLEHVWAGGRAPYPVHLKLDTGMARVGVPRSRWVNVARDLAGTTRLTCTALMTHLACADEPDRGVTERQLEVFDEATEIVTRAGIDATMRHAANTAATLLFPESRLDLVRSGIGIYGLSPSPDVLAHEHGLRQAISVRTQVGYAKQVTAGTSVSYGHRWAAPEDGWVASLPIGYADGVPRALTNRGRVLLGGEFFPMAGTVCMDQILVWCGDRRPDVGEEVVLLGGHADAAPGAPTISVDEWAEHAATISYEITCNFGARLPREEA